MARNKLSDTSVKRFEKPGIYSDGDGLFLRVQKGGSRNWIFIYRRGSQRTEIGLGGYGQGTAPVSVPLARQKAEVLRQQLARGEDPRASLPVAKAALKFSDCMESLLTVKAAEWRNPKHGAQWKMTFREYAKPLHDLPVAEVTVDDVAAVLDYAKARGLRKGDNPAAWKGNLERLLPRRQKLSRGHHAAIDYHAIPAMTARLRKQAGVSARAVEFICLTVARSGEARYAKWPEIDFAKAVWTVPAERMKAGREHRVPLTSRAVEILRSQKKLATSDLVFGGGRDGSPISDTAMTKALRNAAADDTVTLHGLRSSFRDWAGDMTTHPRDVAEAALAHTIQGVEAAYRRKDALEKRRKLMADWSKFVG